MRRWILILALVWAAVAGATDYSRWYPYPQASNLAKESGRILLVYFWSPSCPYCDQMNTFVFPDEAVSGMLEQHFVVASVNSQSPDGHTLSQQMRAFGTPMMVFFVPEKGTLKELGRLYGSRTRAQFYQELKQFCSKGGDRCE